MSGRGFNPSNPELESSSVVDGFFFPPQPNHHKGERKEGEDKEEKKEEDKEEKKRKKRKREGEKTRKRITMHEKMVSRSE